MPKMNAPMLKVVPVLAATPAGMFRRIDLLLTERERLLLSLLIARADKFLSPAQLGMAYGLFDTNVCATSVREDMNGLGEKLKRVIGRDVVHRDDGKGYRAEGIRFFN
jgi:hypothetical protein